MKKALFTALAIIILFTATTLCWPFEQETHRKVSTMIVEQNIGVSLGNGLTFDDYLKNYLNIEDGITHKFDNVAPVNELIGNGAVNEDWTITRSYNHFHNPLLPLESAGQVCMPSPPTQQLLNRQCGEIKG